MYVCAARRVVGDALAQRTWWMDGGDHSRTSYVAMRSNAKMQTINFHKIRSFQIYLNTYCSEMLTVCRRLAIWCATILLCLMRRNWVRLQLVWFVFACVLCVFVKWNKSMWKWLRSFCVQSPVPAHILCVLLILCCIHYCVKMCGILKCTSWQIPKRISTDRACVCINCMRCFHDLIVWLNGITHKYGMFAHCPKHKYSLKSHTRTYTHTHPVEILHKRPPHTER